jgi:hypothetical protein
MNDITRIILFSIFIFILNVSYPRFVQASDTEVTITANYLEYQEEDRYLIARGSVVVSWEGKTLKADTVEMDAGKNYMVARGSASLDEAGSVLLVEAITYDLKKKIGDISKVHGSAAEWFFSAMEARKINDKRFDVYHPRFTSCNLQRPHYTIKATSAKIRPNKNILLYNPVLYFRKVPVIYFPVLPIGLGPHKHDIKVEPGYNSTDGLTLKAIWGYPLTDKVYVKVLYDYYSIRGNGIGGQLDYNTPSMRGTLYTYRVKDEITATERYTLTGSHYQSINSTWTAQGVINYQSDSNFNNAYVTDNWNRVAQKIDSSISLTRQVKASNFRIGTSRTDTFDPVKNSFVPTSIVLPGFSYTRFPVALTKLSIYQSDVLSAANSYDPASGLYSWSGAYNYNLSKSIRVNRNLSLNPQIGFTESWYERESAEKYNSLYRTVSFLSVTARHRPMSWVDIDYAYRYSLRSKYNSIDVDSSANDYGVADNSLSLLNSMYITRRTTMRNSFSYGLQDFRASSYTDWWNRFSPLINELTWMPTFNFNIYLKETNSIHPMVMQSVQTLFSYSEFNKYYLNTGFFFQAATPGQFDINAGVGLTIPNNMVVDYSLNATEYYDVNQFTPVSQQFKITKELHCWLIALRYRVWDIAGKISDEVYLQIQLNPIKNKKASDARLEKEREFYPWR